MKTADFRSAICLLFCLLGATVVRADVPCATPSPVPISANDEAFLKDIVSGLKGGLNPQTNCKAWACQNYLNWMHQFYHSTHACHDLLVDDEDSPGQSIMPMAERIAADIVKHGDQSPFMQDYPQYDAVCPGFGKMNASEKVGFYSWVFENLAFHETTCDGVPENNAANVPNGPAVGIYQLEYDPSVRSWRGPACAVSRQEIMTIEGNTACAYTIFRSELVDTGMPLGTIDAKGRHINKAYWQAFNPTLPATPTKRHPHPQPDAYHKLMRYLKYYPGCYPAAVQESPPSVPED